MLTVRAPGAGLRQRVRDLVHRRARRRLERRDLFAVRAARSLDLAEAWDRTLRLMMARSRVTADNTVRTFHHGDDCFESMWADIDAADHEVLLETYVMEADRVGLRTLKGLADAARRGCRVMLLVDAIGAGGMPPSCFDAAREAGVRVAIFNPPLRTLLGRARFSPFQRDHRKLVVIDGTIAWTGGMNHSEDYAGERHGNGLFTDTHLRLEGPAARELRQTLVELLAEGDVEAGGPPSPQEDGRDVQEDRPHEGSRDTVVQVLESAGRIGRGEIARELRLAIETARHSVSIQTPYFVPPRRIAEALSRAARRGVRVRLLTAGRSDVPIVTFAARHVYATLLRHGVGIFEFQPGVLHAKVALADGIYAMVGSANLDQWSEKRNLELNVGLVGDAVLDALEKSFEERIGQAAEIRLHEHVRRPWWRRVIEWGAYQVMRI